MRGAHVRRGDRPDGAVFLELAEGGEHDARKNDHSEAQHEHRAEADHDGSQEGAGPQEGTGAEEEYCAQEHCGALAVDGSTAQLVAPLTPQHAGAGHQAGVSPREAVGSSLYRQFVKISARLT